MRAKAQLLKDARDELRITLRRMHGAAVHNDPADADRLTRLIQRLDDRLEAGDEDDDETESPTREQILAECVASEIRHDVGLDDLIQPLIDAIAKRAVVVALDDLRETGICTFDFHRSVPDFRSDGICDACDKPASKHDLVPVCPAISRRQAEEMRDEIGADAVRDDADGEVEVHDQGPPATPGAACPDHVQPHPFVRDYRLDALRARMAAKPWRPEEQTLQLIADVSLAPEPRASVFQGWVAEPEDAEAWPSHIRPAVVGVRDANDLLGVLRFGYNCIRNDGHDVTVYFERPDRSQLALKPGDRYQFPDEQLEPLRYVGVHRGPVQ